MKSIQAGGYYLEYYYYYAIHQMSQTNSAKTYEPDNIFTGLVLFRWFWHWGNNISRNFYRKWCNQWSPSTITIYVLDNMVPWTSYVEICISHDYNWNNKSLCGSYFTMWVGDRKKEFTIGKLNTIHYIWLCCVYVLSLAR